MYVHHSFSWKYFKNVPDHVFAKEWKESNNPFHPKAFEMTRYQQEIALLSDIVITVTNHAKDFFINELDIPAKKIVAIYNGMPLPEKKENNLGLRKKYGFTQSEKIILFSGRVTKDKGFPDLLRAFKLVADKNRKVKLVVMGSGSLLGYTSIVKPHWSKIIYTGELEQQQVNDFYQLADIGAIPSLHEQCSFTAIEMRLNKLPVIVGGADGLDELFSHEQDSLKLAIHLNQTGERALDEKEFAYYVERLMADRKFSNFLAKNSYIKGVQKFSSEVMWEKYGQVLTDIYRST
jgi:glycosyltransferase involved in cell wall biosynthesis